MPRRGRARAVSPASSPRVGTAVTRAAPPRAPRPGRSRPAAASSPRAPAACAVNVAGRTAPLGARRSAASSSSTVAASRGKSSTHQVPKRTPGGKSSTNRSGSASFWYGSPAAAHLAVELAGRVEEAERDALERDGYDVAGHRALAGALALEVARRAPQREVDAQARGPPPAPGRARPRRGRAGAPPPSADATGAYAPSRRSREPRLGVLLEVLDAGPAAPS